MAGHERVLLGDLDQAARPHRLPQPAEPIEVGRGRRLGQDRHAELDRGLHQARRRRASTLITMKSGRWLATSSATEPYAGTPHCLAAASVRSGLCPTSPTTSTWAGSRRASRR